MFNKISILKFQIFSVIFVMILGTILHFTFKLSNNNLFVASFSSVNESTWEHLKLVFFPMLITTIIGYFYFGNRYPNFLCAKTLGIFVAMSFVTVFFYTYTGILGTNFAIFDIGSFFIAVLLGEYVSYKKINSNLSCTKNIEHVYKVILIVLLVCFIAFTYFTPRIGYFKDPITSCYGICL